MHIAKIVSQDLPQLDGFDFDCDERVNLFIGPNASGKSTILRAIMRMHSLALSEIIPGVYQSDSVLTFPDGSVGYVDEINYPSPRGGLSFSMRVSYDWPRDDEGNVRWNAVPFLYIPSTRISLPTQHVFEPNIFDQTIDELDGVGAEMLLRFLFDTESGTFNGRYVELAIEQLRRGLIGNRVQQDHLRGAVSLSYSCVQSICSEVMSYGSPHPYVDQYETSDSKRTVHHGMGIETSDNSWHTEQPLYAGALSSGTQGTLLWIYALAIKMFTHYGLPQDAPWMGWEEKPAILLIDEIENHLHPTWQRRVIPALLKNFPGLQIFATTHSPFVVAGLKAGQVNLLRRDGPATTNPQDILGWTADEILRNLMGVDEPTDQLTVDRANRLRQLREKGSLTPEEESELNELRRQVNEDLLSKDGSLGAQRERYADLMEQFLLSRQSELSHGGD